MILLELNFISEINHFFEYFFERVFQFREKFKYDTITLEGFNTIFGTQENYFQNFWKNKNPFTTLKKKRRRNVKMLVNNFSIVADIFAV